MLKKIFKNKNVRLELTKKLTKLDEDITVNDVRGIKIMTLMSILSFPLAALGTFMLFSTYTETQIESILHFMFVMFLMICSFSLIFMSSAFSIFGLLNYFGFKRKNKDMSIYFKK